MEGCSITIRLTKSDTNTFIHFKDHSQITGERVFINSPSSELLIDETSSIDASGRSRNNVGSSPDNSRGASYLGHGGYCGVSENNHVYGSYDMTPNENIYDMQGMTLIGSAGQAFPLDKSTEGGGHIHINVDSINLLGQQTQIHADGLPERDQKNPTPDDLNGGSGGYIYIKTNN
jgi:hypothetical protein